MLAPSARALIAAAVLTGVAGLALAQSGGNGGVGTAASARDRRTEPPGGQLAPAGPHGAAAAGNGGVAQIGEQGRSALPGRQVSDGRPIDETQAPLSPRAEGRRTDVVRIGGSDRCDPQARTSRSSLCRRPIETRAADFARRDQPALTPEQRLLVDLGLGRDRGDPVAAARTSERIDPRDGEAQALASVVLRPDATPTPAPTASSAIDASTAALIAEAIAQGTTTTVTRPTTR